MILICLLVLIQIGFNLVNGAVNGLGASPHVHYVTENICSVISTFKIDMYYNRVKIQCDWKKFVDAIEYEKHLDPGSYEASLELSQTQHLYDFEFIIGEPISNDFVYSRIDKNMFRNFRVRSLSFRNLSIRHVDYDSFNQKCCANTLQLIDLSDNKLTRFDSTHLVDLKRLESLNLANNQLQFGERNFEYNKNLRVLNLSGNKLQYLPSQLFYNLNELEQIDLSNNFLRSVDSCAFNKIQLNPIARQFDPARVNLLNNSIDCDCHVFYLNRHLNLKLNLTCISPKVYAGRHFASLNKEDPSKRCLYIQMEKSCIVKTNFYELVIIVVLASMAAFFLLVSMCCLCKNVMDTDSLDRAKRELQHANNKPKVVRTSPVYVDINTGILPSNNSDNQKLLG